MKNPPDALQRWWNLVKPGGYLIFLVPDEDLYEQGYWPSVFNHDHKFTFTLKKESSWPPVSINVLDLIQTLTNVQIIEVSEQNHFYDKSLLNPVKIDQNLLYRRTKILRRMRRWLGHFSIRTQLLPLVRYWNLPSTKQQQERLRKFRSFCKRKQPKQQTLTKKFANCVLLNAYLHLTEKLRDAAHSVSPSFRTRRHHP